MPGSADPPSAAADGPAEIIRADRATRRFGSLTAVSDVSFNVSAGDIVGLAGSDGAGKTTLLRMLAAMLAPSSGTIRVGGLDVVRERSRVKELIGYMPQRFGLYPDLTVAENLDFFIDIYGISGVERDRRRERYLGFSDLLPFVDRKAADLSGGMKQKLGLACVLVHEPRLLILDEPTNGVDPLSRQEFWQILAEMKQAGMTILVATAYLDEGERCDRLLLMHNTRILADAAPAKIRAEFASLEEAMIQRIRAVDAELTEDAFGR
ncbi:MAG TPA: ABC transporter ATP-binding protein [Desulfobacterales bacterium]|jgi:ABC-2 type transport system ATP-binding protein|nr:ABC transporter ATP-binding protein [Desulfobacterales bacterium]